MKYRNLIKKRLEAFMVNEDQKPIGLSSTEKIQKDSKSINKAAIKDVEKTMKAYDSSSTGGKDKVEPKMRKLDKSEKEYSEDIEMGGGMQDLRYDGEVDKNFKERQEMAIKGDSKMGNKVYTGKDNGNTESVWGASTDDFGKKLVDRTKRAKERIDKAGYNTISMGDDIEVSGKKLSKRNVAVESVDAKESIMKEGLRVVKVNYANGDSITTSMAANLSDDEIRDYYKVGKKFNIGNGEKDNLQAVKSIDILENKEINKEQIKEGKKMKRLTFKKEFTDVENAVSRFPAKFKEDGTIVEMTDKSSTYKVRWEGTLTEGKAVVLISADQKAINEDMKHMKHLMGYKSEDTLGTVKGAQRIEENAKFSDIWNKTKELIKESDEEEEIIK